MTLNLKKHAITRDHAAAIVKSAPGQLGQEYIIDHVHKALAEAYKSGRRTGELEAREGVARTELAFWEGVEMQGRGRANEIRKDLEALLRALGKVTT